MDFLKCVVIQQNESEVGCDMLLISEVLFRFDIWMSILNQTLVANSWLVIHRSEWPCYVNPDLVGFTSVWWLSNSTDLCSMYNTNLNPVTCRYRLPTHSAWFSHNILIEASEQVDRMSHWKLPIKKKGLEGFPQFTGYLKKVLEISLLHILRQKWFIQAFSVIENMLFEIKGVVSFYFCVFIYLCCKHLFVTVNPCFQFRIYSQNTILYRAFKLPKVLQLFIAPTYSCFCFAFVFEQNCSIMNHLWLRLFFLCNNN